MLLVTHLGPCEIPTVSTRAFLEEDLDGRCEEADSGIRQGGGREAQSAERSAADRGEARQGEGRRDRIGRREQDPDEPLDADLRVSDLEGLSPGLHRWLELEQTVNDRRVNDAVYAPIDDRSNGVAPAHRPERRGIWPQRVVWLPTSETRVYGPLRSVLRTTLGAYPPRGRVPLLFHPQATRAHAALAGKFGSEPFGGLRVSPTASHRALLAWRRGRTPLILKLSIGAVVGQRRRALHEEQIARAVVMSRVLASVPLAHRTELRFDWFDEPAGMVETRSGNGWLFRTLPRRLARRGRSLVPAFSLASLRGDRPPLLVDLVRRSGATAESFVLEHLLRPYVGAIAYLLFVQGIELEAHAQNVLFEVDGDDRLTGWIVFRDLSDSWASVPIRLARQKPLPRLRRLLSDGRPYAAGSIAADHRCHFGRPVLWRGFDIVERYGLWSFVWSVNRALAPFVRGWDAQRIERAYLDLWQEQASDYLGVKPLLRGARGLATDEAIAYFLAHRDWSALGATRGHRLPPTAEPLRIRHRARRRATAVYDRLECEWGDLYVLDDLPVFFRPIA